MKHSARILALLLFASTALNAALNLGMPFSDHMVLQSGAPVPVWGTAAPGEKITVQFAGQTRTTAAAQSGEWRVTLAPLEISTDAQTLTVRGTETASAITLTDVLVGEVWLCSGQSNMRYCLGRHANVRDEKTPLLFPRSLAAATNPRIRLLNVTGGTPADRKWGACTPANAESFSAIGYHFGAALQQARDIPVGLVDLGQGGASIRVFIPQKIFDANPAFNPPPAKKTSKAPTPSGTRFAADVVPLAPFALRGVLWYQGESDAGRGTDVYAAMLRTLIAEWRSTFEAPALPFIIVQLPPWERRHTDKPDARPAARWPEVREAQARVASSDPHATLAVISEYGERHDIHPHRKREVGERLSLIARAAVYNEPVEHSGPEPLDCVASGNNIEITFKYAEGGLFARAGQLDYFEVAGADGKFVPAMAQITGLDKLIVTPPRDMKVKQVRYAWRDWFEPTLYNGHGLPAGPFSLEL